MAFSRTIQKGLIEWMNNEHHKPLVIRGARQVGKTTVIRDFGKHFKTFIELNLEKSSDRAYFTADMNPKRTFQQICLEKGIIPNGKILLFLDEIQNSPQAVAMLRYFYEEMPELYIISAGSLLEIMMKKNQISFPVGRVEYLYLYPLSFREFLIATDNEQALNILNEIPVQNWAVPHLFSMFKLYTLIGGMPEAVNKYNKSMNITDVSSVYRNLFSSYIDDSAKYASNSTEEHILPLFIEAAPKEIGKRITFEKFASTNYRSREASEALRTLQNAMLLYICYPTTNLQLPLQTDMTRKPRLQFLDTGLVNFAAGIQSIYLTSAPLDALYNGMIAEQIVGQELLASNYNERKNPLFWVRDNPKSSAEVDFLIIKDSQIVPIEVKSGKTGTLRSLHSFIDFTNNKIAVRLYSGDISIENTKTPKGTPYTLLNLPLFLADSIGEYIDKML